MAEKVLIIYIPVIHRGYLDFLKNMGNKVSQVFIIDETLLAELTEFKPDIASIESDKIKDLLLKFGFRNIFVLTKENIAELKDKEIILVQDEVSCNLADKYLSKDKVEWQNVFLRWDRSQVLRQEKLEDISVSNDEFDIKTIKQAFGESEKSGDWWRQIGAVLVKDKETLLCANNKDLPSDHTPYQTGEVRDLFSTGERPDLANTIHAEQSIIAQAAKKGLPVKGTSLYVTTFPCPVCAKLIACSGIKNVYFAEGWSNFDAKKVLESAGVKIIHVPI